MNEFDEIPFKKKNEKKEKKKRILLIGIFICIILIILSILAIMYFKKVDNNTFKLFINDAQTGFGEGFYITNENGETYVRAKDIANFIGWSYQNGEYGSYTEEINSGYIQNEYEVASFVAGSNVLKKYIQVEAEEKVNELGETVKPYKSNSENGTLETTTMELPIISQNNQIYFPLKNLNDICNCTVNYENKFRMYIYDQNYLVNLARNNATQFGYQSISGTYENIRALSYGMMVVSNGSSYGVVNLYDGKNIIGLKYSNMVFAQNVKEFFVNAINSNDEETVGIIDINGKIIVSPKNYSSIQVLSDNLGLYLVYKDEKYGVLNRQGDIIIHCEYDSIGIPDELLKKFNFSIDKSKYLLFDNTIIVKKDDKYGIFDTEGNQKFPTAFVGLGYTTETDSSSAGNSDDILTIEIDNLKFTDGSTKNIKGIIVQQLLNDTIKYGVYETECKKLILPCVYDRIYSKTSGGKTDYYIEIQDETNKLDEQIAKYPEDFN